MRVDQLEQTLEQSFRQTKSRMDFIINSSLRSRGGVSVGTQSIQYMLNREIEVFIEGARRIVYAASAVSMDEITQDAIMNATSEVADAMVQFASAARTRVNRKDGLARVHELVANEARAAVLDKYERTIGSNGHPIYRKGQNRLTGRIEQALQRPDVIRAQRDGIIFGNVAVLDAVAAHWRRLNFGAGSRGQSRGQQPAPLMLEGQRIGLLRFGIGPSPAFDMPSGIFFEGNTPVQFGGKNQAFYPLGMAIEKLRKSGMSARDRAGLGVNSFVASKHPTAGITGAHFFEAGLFVLGQRLPGEYLKLAKQWITEAADEIHPRGPIAAARGLR